MKRIFLVRHGESETNVDRTIGLTKPDHRIDLTQTGVNQAKASGEFLNRWLQENVSPQHKGKIRLWHSPYVRAIQTADHVAVACQDWLRDIREHVLLCEQQFGLFDGVYDEELPKKFPREHEHYKKCEEHEGRFWARIPLGESRFDVATRVHQAFGTFHRDSDRHDIDNIIIVAHGVTIRAFLMMWLHLGVDWFENEPNPQNGTIRLIERNFSGKMMDRGYIYKGRNIPCGKCDACLRGEELLCTNLQP